MKNSARKPAYKEPWFWLVLGPLLLVIVASLLMVALAFHVADDRVRDDYYKEGRMINKRFAEEEKALALAVQGTIHFDFAAAQVTVDLAASALPDELSLTFSHPAAAARDLVLTLRRVGAGRYSAALPALAKERWYLILAAPAQGWRVTTEVDLLQAQSAAFAAHL